MSLSFIEVASGRYSKGAARGTDADSAGKRWAGASGRRGLHGLLGCPVSQPLMWAGPGQAGAGGREPQAGPLGPVGGAPRLADGVQSVGQGVHLILDAVQGAPDGVGTVQHVDGQCVWVKLHREGALDAGGIAPVGGEATGTLSHQWGGSGVWGLSPPAQWAQSPRTFLSLRPPKLILSSHPDKSGDQDLLQGVGKTGPFPSEPLPGIPSRPAPSQGRRSQASSSRKASRRVLWRVRYVPVHELACEIHTSFTPGSIDPGPQFPS